MRGTLFISYRRSANANALAQIEQVLVDAFGAAHVFLDKEAIRGGDAWARRITEALRTAPAVLVLYSAEWRGAVPGDPGGAARIDDASDWVRKELVIAHQHRRPLLPLIIDDSKPPSANELPRELVFLAQAQFQTFDPRRPEAVVAALRRLVYGPRWWGRLFAQVTWIAAGVSSLVLALSLTVGGAADNAFARAAATLREQLGWQRRSDDIVIVEVDDREFRELFGSRMPLDGEVLAIMLDALRRASERAGTCAHNRPVAINLELAPSGAGADEHASKALADSLGALARCRPVVLACPQQVEMRAQGVDEETWMQELRRQTGETGTLVFGSTRTDPEGLRYSELRSELGLVAADIARLPDVAAGAPRPPPYRTGPCVCPTDRAAAVACDGAVNDWNEHALAVRLDHAGDRTLSAGLQGVDHVAAHRIVMIGATFGAPHAPMKRGANERVSAAPSATVRQSHLLHGALAHAPPSYAPWMLAGLFGYSWIVTALALLGGVILERNSDRLFQRVNGYVLGSAASAAAVLVPLLVAAAWPAWTWAMVPLLLAGVLAAGRSILANFELVMRGQPGWHSPKVLWDDLLTATHKGSAMTRIAVLAFEVAVMLGCWLVVAIVVSRG